MFHFGVIHQTRYISPGFQLEASLLPACFSISSIFEKLFYCSFPLYFHNTELSNASAAQREASMTPASTCALLIQAVCTHSKIFWHSSIRQTLAKVACEMFLWLLFRYSLSRLYCHAEGCRLRLTECSLPSFVSPHFLFFLSFFFSSPFGYGAGRFVPTQKTPVIRKRAGFASNEAGH